MDELNYSSIKKHIDPTEIYESRLLFLNSMEKKNFNDNPSFCQFEIPPELIQIDSQDDEVIQITLVDFYCPYSWYNIQNDYNNKFTLVNFTTSVFYDYVISEGSQDICDIVKELSQQNNQVYKFEYNKNTSRVRISTLLPGTNFFVEVGDRTFKLLGFDSALFAFSNFIISQNIVNILRTENLYIRLPQISNHENIEYRLNTFRYTFSNILAKVPVINTKPFDMLYYQSRNNNYKIKYEAKNINQFYIEITDYEERQLNLNLDWNMTLRVDFLRYPEIPPYFNQLKQIEENLGLLLVNSDKILNK
jgi:hypothetical protein